MIGRRVFPIHSPLSSRVLYESLTDAVLRRGDAGAQVEALLRREYDAEDALLVDSGTHALELALRIAARAAGGDDRVALPAYTCFDVATAAIGAGARVSLFDIDPRTLAPDLESLSRVLETGVRTVVVSPLYGIPVDWDAIERCAGAYGALVIEDAAQGQGSTWQTRRVGGHGRLSVLSFGRGKGWTGGCGGALLARGGITDTCGLLATIAPPASGRFAGFARAGAQWVFARSALYALPASVPWLGLGTTQYHEPSAPRGLSSVAAGLIKRSFGLATAEAERRRQHARTLITELASLAAACPARRIRPVQPDPGGVPGYLRFPLLMRDGISSLASARIANALGIMPGYPSTLAELDAVRAHLARAPGGEPCPGASEIARELVTLPTHSQVTQADLQSQLALLSGGLPTSD